ncbi:protein transport protein Sec24-like At4g32640 [Salvia hispanica]|uniref:protein transport protein Sec24-like At4g32640 n=1 Tax=Salvia hispanica TaxID=49212 RepID=UPI0020090B96|nr:protein transport protein Sec24-like At4g32640 [Salvia hispanica]
MATPRGPRPGAFPPNHNPNTLANNLQNLQINQFNRQELSNAGSGGQQPLPFAAGQPRPPPYGAFQRGLAPPVGPGQSTLPPDAMPARPAGPALVSQPLPFSSRPPPPGVLSMGSAPPVAPGQSTLRPDAMPARPNGPTLASQPPPFASRPPPPGVLQSSIGGPAAPRPGPLGPPTPPQMISNGPVGNGPPAFAPGMMQSGSRPPPPVSNLQRPPPPTMLSSQAPSQPLQTRPGFGGPPTFVSSSVGQPGPPFSTFLQGPTFPGSSNMPPPPGPLTPPPVQGTVQSSGHLHGMQSWPQQPLQVGLSRPTHGAMQQQQQMFGMPPGPPPFPNQSMALGQTDPSQVDANHIPPYSSSSAVIQHETHMDNHANPPPPATSTYIVKDNGNCSPRYMRCTLNQVPCTVDLLSTSKMQLALLVQPLALPHPSEEPIHVVDFGESGPVRCSRCKGYINPFMKFIDQGKRFICNLCGFTGETPHEYQCNLGPDGRRRDADERPELCRGTVEFIAPKEYMVRDPMPAVFFFLVDVSMHAIQTGATAAACSAISQVIPNLPEGPRTMVAIATFDSTIHFYKLKCAQQQPSILIVPDVQDVYTPLTSDIVVQLTECREHLEILLDSIPGMFQDNRTTESAFGAAAKAAFLAIKSTGGKLLVFQSILPSIGIGSLFARDAEGKSNTSAGEKEPHKLLQPMDKTLQNMATEFAEFQVCVDLFITTQTYVDVASLSVVPRTTGGQVYYYYPFSALSDLAKLSNDLRWNVTRPQGFEAVMRLRCSEGIQVQEYSGNYYNRNPADVDFPAIDCDKTIMVSLKHNDKLREESGCSFQCALLYTTIYGQRRIRVSTLYLPCTNNLTSLFVAPDLDTLFSCILKQAAKEMTSAPLSRVKDIATKACINILHSYSKFCATKSSSALLMPEALKFLPLYTLALLKSHGLSSDGRIDERSFWLNYVSPLPTPSVIPLIYPRMIAIHDLDEKESEDSIIPAVIPLSSIHISDEGIYLLENGIDCLVYVGASVQQNVLTQLFGVSSVEEISNQFMLQQYDNPLSKKLNDVLNEIRRQRCSYLRLKFCKKGDSSEAMFLSNMVEDRMPSGAAYADFVALIRSEVQKKKA